MKFLLIFLTVLNMESPFMTQVTLRRLGLDAGRKLNIMLLCIHLNFY